MVAISFHFVNEISVCRLKRFLINISCVSLFTRHRHEIVRENRNNCITIPSTLIRLKQTRFILFYVNAVFKIYKMGDVLATMVDTCETYLYRLTCQSSIVSSGNASFYCEFQKQCRGKEHYSKKHITRFCLDSNARPIDGMTDVLTTRPPRPVLDGTCPVPDCVPAQCTRHKVPRGTWWCHL